MKSVRGKVGFYLENNLIPDIDFRYPEKGNPGSGGTQFLFVAIPYYLKKLYGSKIDPILFVNAKGALPSNLDAYKVKDLNEAALKAKEIGCMSLVYRPRRDATLGFFPLIEKLDLECIAWAHVTPKENHLREMAQCSQIKACICVGNEQHDQLLDSPITSKLTVIPNAYDIGNALFENTSRKKEPNLVVYLGALVPQKGFHMLAKVWPQILKQHPNAKLSVIGSGKLYSADTRLGRWGVAESSFEENSIIPYLQGNDGEPMPSVTFHGRMGLNRSKILGRAIIGIPNPTGATETFCLAATELSAHKVAIVSGAYNGLNDTVVHGNTGLLGRSEQDLIDNICYFLENSEKAYEYGQNGYEFVSKTYNFEKITEQWMLLFQSFSSSTKIQKYGFRNSIFRDYKYLIAINKYLQIAFGRFLPWPSVCEMKKLIINGLKWLK